jgi:RNA-directed DNA polymerase
MSVERQQKRPEQLSLFEQLGAMVRPAVTGEGGTGSGTEGEKQALTVMEEQRALTLNLMERITHPSNLNAAYRRVKSNKGAPGIDGMTVVNLGTWLSVHRGELTELLLTGDYRPQPVKGEQIPKPGGGMRQLGIPTVRDRLVQQAILQVLDPIFDSTFSESSYGFRPRRGAHHAILKASEYVSEGFEIVVDLDLEKFFDHVNHDILMSRLARRIGDKRLLRIIRRFLQAGMMQNGVCIERIKGTPQGGPLSPLLANILLDDFDKELEGRGHRFCRYADDANIYVRTKKAGERVMASVTGFLEKKLRLRVNLEKSAVDHVWNRKFLGYRLLSEGRLGIAPKSLQRAKDRVRRITRRNRGVKLAVITKELNEFLSGWITYFRYAECHSHLNRLDKWIRRKIRCYRLKQRKRVKSIAEFLKGQGLPQWRSWLLALSGKGWWRMSGTPQASEAMPIKWFDELGLICLVQRYKELRN